MDQPLNPAEVWITENGVERRPYEPDPGIIDDLARIFDSIDRKSACNHQATA